MISPQIAIGTFDATDVGNDVHIVVYQLGVFNQNTNTYIPPKLHHTILFASGSWHPVWGDMLANVPGTPTNLVISGSSCAGIGNELHVVVSDAYTGKLWHTIRLANGDWTPWGDVMLATMPATAEVPPDLVNQLPPDFVSQFPFPDSLRPSIRPLTIAAAAVSCAGVGPDLHVIAVDYYTRFVWHTIRFANGNWTPWGPATLVIPPPRYTPSYAGYGCAGVGSNLHIVG